MRKKHIVILGAGITGLTFARSLPKDRFDITLLEKSERVGGCLQSESSDGFFFEATARTFVTGRSQQLLQLIHTLHLEGSLIYSAEEAKKRYLWNGTKLKRMDHPLSLLTLGGEILAEPFRKRERVDDESVADFVRRRFGKKVLEQLFDPLVLGIYGADSEMLSISSCFPKFKGWEERYGSCLKGLLKERQAKGSQLFSLKGGTQTLVDALENELKEKIFLNEEVESLSFQKESVVVQTRRRKIEADLLVSTLPIHAMYALFSPLDSSIAAHFGALHATSLTTIQLGYHALQLPLQGFGYLVPSKWQEPLLGVVFDSSIFPEQNQRKKEVRLTLMLREGGLTSGLDALQRHLGIKRAPDFSKVQRLENAIPQYRVGHGARVESLLKSVSMRFPRLKLLGSYLDGVSVNDCVARALRQADLEILQCL